MDREPGVEIVSGKYVTDPVLPLRKPPAVGEKPMKRAVDIIHGEVIDVTSRVYKCPTCDTGFMTYAHVTKWDDGKLESGFIGIDEYTAHMKNCERRDAVKKMKEKIGFNRMSQEVCGRCNSFVEEEDTWYCDDLEEGAEYCGLMKKMLEDAGLKLDSSRYEVEKHDSCNEFKEKEE